MSNSKTKKPFKPDRSTQGAVEEKWKKEEGEVTNEENRNPLLGIAVWLIVITVATFLLFFLQ
jgi:hypothetical protein